MRFSSTDAYSGSDVGSFVSTRQQRWSVQSAVTEAMARIHACRISAADVGVPTQLTTPMRNADPATVAGFGTEWTTFDQSRMPDSDATRVFDSYFSLFPWASLPEEAVGFDLGCGSGRWASRVAPRVGHLHCIDASPSALAVARRNLSTQKNCTYHIASVDAIPLDDNTMDFGYSLGVLHHVPDTAAGIAACVRKLKVGAPFLLYLYYDLDNRPFAFRAAWRLSELLRSIISRLPHLGKMFTTTALALGVYFPLSRLARGLERLGLPCGQLPLHHYRHLSLYTMRTDAYDRFGTRLEQRFRREQVHAMMIGSGLERVSFREATPYWCAVGFRRPQ